MPRRFPWILALVIAFAPGVGRSDDTSKNKDAESEKPTPPILVDLTLKGAIPEPPGPVGLEGTPLKDNLKSLLDRIRQAKADPEVKGLVVRLRDLSIGLAKAHELREALADFRESGKKSFALIEQAGNAEYFIATAADEILMPESGTLMIHGLAAEVVFFKKAFEKFGIQADMLQVGKYKAAAEPFTRSEMSPAFREEMASVLADNYAILAEAIAERRNVSVEQAKALLDGGPYTPEAAKKAGLIDTIAYPDEVEKRLADSLDVKDVKLAKKYGKDTKKTDYSGFAGFMKMLQALSGESVKKAESDKPKVALIYATGTIQSGKSSSGGLTGGEVMGSDSIIADLKKAAEDKTVKAIVLRIDSPGGSALASDLIWRQIVTIDKPIIASMSDVAGSGGYYIAVGADKIYAEPGTLTGSIGVVGGKIAVGGLLDRLGITTDTVTVGENGLMDSMFRPFSDEEKEAVHAMMRETYKQFVGKTAEGREMEFSRVEELAGGRVYSGRKAKELGLIDEVGTLADALADARQQAGMEEDETDLLILPESKGFLEDLFGPIEDMETAMPASGFLATIAALPEPARGVLARAARVAELLTNERVLVIMPFDVRIH